jgi:nucleoside-diphosphate-sugar epimerase
MTPSRVVVTGATGFIGGHVTRHLAARGFDVRGFGRDLAGLGTAMQGADAVVHLAAYAHGARRPAIDPVRINLDLTRAVFEAAAAARVPRFINMSSIGVVVARSENTVDDSTLPGAVSLYGRSKRAAEDYLIRAGRGTSMAITSLRPPAVYGPGMRGKSAMLFRLIERNVPLPIGGIENSRSFLYVGNLAAAVAMALNSAPAPGSFVVSDSDPISTPEFARRIGAALGRPARIVTLPRLYVNFVNALARVAPFIRFPLDAESVDELRASLPVDSTLFWKTVGNTPPFSMADGLRLTAEAMRGR